MTQGKTVLQTMGQFVEGSEDDYTLSPSLVSSIQLYTYNNGLGSAITNLSHPASSTKYAIVVNLNENLTFTNVAGADIRWSQSNGIFIDGTVSNNGGNLIFDATNKKVTIVFSIDSSSALKMFQSDTIIIGLYEITCTNSVGRDISVPCIQYRIKCFLYA